MADLSSESFDRAFLGFSDFLKGLGIKANHHRVQTAYRAVSAFGGFGERDNLYWAGRLSFCASPEDLVVYDRAFHAWFGRAAGGTSKAATLSEERLVAVPSDQRPPSGEREIEWDAKKVATASELETLRNADIALLAPNARAEVENWIARLRPLGTIRRTRRFNLQPNSLIDRRRSVRRALKSGGEISEIVFRSRKVVPRKIVFLIDISGSMKSYANAYLRFAYATKKVRPSTEVFTVGTRLTRVTPVLTGANIARAINRAMSEIPDWSGGTRLGVQFRHFLKDPKGTARGAIVVIASDGWERGDVQILGESVSQLSKSAKRIIWVNPHLHRPGFAPLTSGMEIVLPHIDRLVSGHSFKSFEDLCQELAGPTK